MKRNHRQENLSVNGEALNDAYLFDKVNFKVVAQCFPEQAQRTTEKNKY
jgi:hypothetical protein